MQTSKESDVSGIFKEYEDKKSGEKVFLVRDFIEVRIPLSHYRKLEKRYPKEYIVSIAEPRKVISHVTKRELVVVTRESGIPLLGHAAFGLIDRGTNLIQVRCVTGCNLNCIFCSVDEGRRSRTRAADYLVEPEYLAEKLKEIAEFKGKGVEAHIDGQGEPLLYPYMEELLERISRIKEVEVISMQTNGTLLNDDRIDMLEKYVTRINLSISALDQKKASRLAGIKYPLSRVLENAKMIAESKMDLLIAPVWVPGYNDDEIEKIIRFALEIGAGKRYPPLGIQKYIPYRYGRKLKNVMSFREFYDRLVEWEKEYGVKLILRPEDFGMEKRPRIPQPIRKGERFRARLIAEGRMFGEKLAVVRDRVVTVRTDRKVGDFATFEIVRTHDGIFLAEEV
ncbi:radical SAM protein [Archaeoglobus veneficus]|uniref:Radical SAM domain protein n=1 Tax=Archaeoglobus veneficus (strain DSM 11195 / SNP6) TaxID=693661 RepID=F2KR87_ARCVS|nr:radical SAM protein [Archaeoglobus veneficus]AEA46724.1 Radical SAM domain protein [Archaeoglobus veneficus SNP6]